MAKTEMTVHNTQAGTTPMATNGRKKTAVKGGFTNGGPSRPTGQVESYMAVVSPRLSNVAALWKARKSQPTGVPD